jgi:hypothetical protein
MKHDEANRHSLLPSLIGMSLEGLQVEHDYWRPDSLEFSAMVVSPFQNLHRYEDDHWHQAKHSPDLASLDGWTWCLLCVPWELIEAPPQKLNWIEIIVNLIFPSSVMHFDLTYWCIG